MTRTLTAAIVAALTLWTFSLAVRSVRAEAESPAAATVEVAAAASGGQSECRAAIGAIEEQNQRLHQELRQIKRELAQLNQNLDKPGAREIIAGTGFILGLFGAAALVSARRQG